MAEISYSVADDANGINVYIYIDGVLTITQPYHPNAVLKKGVGKWDSTEAAQAWGAEMVAELQASRATVDGLQNFPTADVPAAE